jgi:Tol biopolymer transport system component
MSFRFYGAPNQVSNGFYKFATRPPATSAPQWLPDSSASDPDWSPDGQHIVFADPTTKGGERDIWIIRSDTNQRSAAIRLTSGPADDSHPRFSADGSTIYFVSNRANNYGLNGIFNTERRGYNIWSVKRFDRP